MRNFKRFLKLMFTLLYIMRDMEQKETKSRILIPFEVCMREVQNINAIFIFRDLYYEITLVSLSFWEDSLLNCVHQ